MKCPGQDTRFWDRDAVYDVACPSCGRAVEFFKDDAIRRCPGCGYRFRNPRLDLGCAEWCPHAEQCLGDVSKVLAARGKRPVTSALVASGQGQPEAKPGKE